ncbi:MAG: Fic family protein [Alphaproteobacteria bacterium]|nr:Fic family protein [Alphaproteobacteria bacterium]
MNEANTYFEEYKEVGEADKKERAKNWSIAIGLQQTDGLTPSKYLVELAKKNIEGEISLSEVHKNISRYYETSEGKALGRDTSEADRVSAHIADLLRDPSFDFIPTMLCAIHDKLFYDVYPEWAGKFRKTNITKSEEILNGGTIGYGDKFLIVDSLKRKFDEESAFNYSGLDIREKIEHIVKFISGIWQTHPFREGNTRTIAVFTIKYLRLQGFEIGNEMFDKHSKYFRNALVRANYQNLATNVSYTMAYLNRFFGNLLLGENNRLDNADLQLPIDKAEKITDKKANIGNHTDKIAKITDKFRDITDKIKKSELNFLTEIYDFLENGEEISNAQAQELSGKSPESIKKYFAALVKAGILTATGERKSRKYKLNDKGIK